MNQSMHVNPRISEMKFGEIYFWTATINQWQHLLHNNLYKEVIISSLSELSHRRLIDVFAFVIMPNHIHLIWRLNLMNGKENPKSSFLKYTAHQFKRLILATEPHNLQRFYVIAENKQYEFWQRDPMAIILYSKKVILQKLSYIHNNPLASHWQLAKEPCDYKYSSASFYEMNNMEFEFLKDIRVEF